MDHRREDPLTIEDKIQAVHDAVMGFKGAGITKIMYDINEGLALGLNHLHAIQYAGQLVGLSMGASESVLEFVRRIEAHHMQSTLKEAFVNET